jgi:hypothetical protein
VKDLYNFKKSQTKIEVESERTWSKLNKKHHICTCVNKWTFYTFYKSENIAYHTWKIYKCNRMLKYNITSGSIISFGVFLYDLFLLSQLFRNYYGYWCTSGFPWTLFWEFLNI